MFGLLLLNANYLQVVKAEDLHNDSSNPRLILEEYSRERGPILVAGRPVASSVETDDRLKYQRTYSQGRLYAPATGFYSLVYGASAIESEENSVLAGTDDSLFVRRVIDLLTGEQPRGGSVQLTLDPAAQRAGFEGLAGRKGAVVALDPTTGAILALVTSPSYDPSVLSTHEPAKVRDAYAELSTRPSKPMLDRALRQTYPPGSTFKVVTSAAALESGKYEPDSKVFNGDQLDLPQTTANLPNYDGQPCSLTSGEATLTDALARSCNAAFGKIGLDLGGEALRSQAEKFGFNRAVEVPMRSAPSVFPEDPNAPQTAQSAIGQFDVRATPLQMAMVAAAVANRGVVMQPHLVQEVLAPDLSVLDKTRAQEMGTAMSPQTADDLNDMMVNVVENGTGSNAQIDGIRVGGKTGTAQQGTDRKPHAWFISFAPANDPKVAVAVVLEDGGGAPEVSGNQLAAPIARSV
ncbi:MAG: peptidoglycan D,D-transpeptidase FtsI family protein, partial [Actinomycetes bacterium]